MNLCILVSVWGTLPTVYEATIPVELSCHHEFMGVYQITDKLQVIPLPGDATNNPSSRTYPPQKYLDGTFTAGDAVKRVVLVRDLDNQVQYYVDYESYYAQLGNCNRAPYVTYCSSVTGLSAGTPGATSATITFTADAGAAGYEWINNTSGTTPVIDGAYITTTPVAVTGLTTGTLYHFWIRKVCIGGLKSAWVALTYTTA